MTTPQDPFSTPPPDRQAGADGDPQPAGPPLQYGNQPYGDQQYASQQYVQPFGAPGHSGPPKNGLGVAALVLGVLALLTGFFLVGAVFGVVAIVLGVIGRSRAKRGEATNGGMALAGIVLGVLGILTAVFVGFAVVSLFGEEFSSFTECVEQAQTQSDADQCQVDFEQDLTG